MAYLNVYLAGPEKSEWDGELISECSQFHYFQPIRDSYTSEAQAERARQRDAADTCVYAYTPEMLYPFFLFELVDDSNLKPTDTYFLYLREYDGYRASARTWTWVEALVSLLEGNSVTCYDNMDDLVTQMEVLIAAAA
jgi:hypothetical protein